MFRFIPNPNIENEVKEDALVKAAIGQVAQAGVEFARQRVPVDTGELQASIEATETEDGWAVVAGTDHWLFPEFGTSEMPSTPYLRPIIEDLGLSR